MELFLVSKNLLTLLVCVPVHGICVLLCARDARFFDLVLLWARLRLPAMFANLKFWRASSYSPLILDLPNNGRRRLEVIEVRVQAKRVPRALQAK